MTACRWDREREAYLRDGEPCKTDDYGDPTVHCTARGSCANHIGRDELTCARCLGRTRTDLRVVRDLAGLMLPVAIGAGVDSEAASLAGPACDVEAWSWRKVAARQGIAWHLSLEEDDDERHAYTVLTRWEFMLREDYGQQRDDATSVSEAAAYLDRTLHRMAQDPEQDWALFAREIRKCRSHLEGVLRNSRTPEKGAPCPECSEQGRVVRMTRSYPHWCIDPDCERLHYSVTLDKDTGEFVPDTSQDWWRCSWGHERSHEDYTRWIEERKVGA